MSDGNWCYEEERLQLEVVNYLTNLYTIDGQSIGRFPVRERFPAVDLDMMEAMGRSLIGEEVRTTQFEMTQLKSPRVDGFHAQCYQTQWNIVGESLVDMIRRVFNEGDIEPFFNKTVIVLILKVDAPEVISQYRPISLCLVSYKVLTKVIVNNLKPILSKLIAPNQTRFMGGKKQSR